MTPFEADSARKANGLRDFNSPRLRSSVCANCLVLRKFHYGSECRKYRRMTDKEWAEYCGIGQEKEGSKNQLRNVHTTGGVVYFEFDCGHSEARAAGTGAPLPERCPYCEQEKEMGWLNGKEKAAQASVQAPAPAFEAPQQTAPPAVVPRPYNANTQAPLVFKKAVKSEAKGRVALIGPAGSGKSYTMLLLARTLAGPNGRIAAIDTEHGSLSKYADVFDFDVVELDSFTPETFVTGLHSAEQAGYDVFCCDSLSHFWTGRDGALEFVDMAAKRHRDGMGGWKEFRPHERQMVDEMLSSPCHVICTMRTKTEYQEQTDPSTGKKKRVKVGLAPVQREGLEYEFDLVGYMDEENTFITDKTRCSFYSQKAYTKPGPQEFEPLVKWLEGAAREPRTIVAQIDTGSHPVGTQAAADYVAQQKIASGNAAAPAPLKAPWATLIEAEQIFQQVRERVGEVVWREEIECFGWQDLPAIRNAMGSRDKDTRADARQKARELYWHLDALARKEGK